MSIDELINNCNFLTASYLHCVGVATPHETFKELILTSLKENDLNRAAQIYFPGLRVEAFILCKKVKTSEMMHLILSQFTPPYDIIYCVYYIEGLYKNFKMPPLGDFFWDEVPPMIIQNKIEEFKNVPFSKMRGLELYRIMAAKLKRTEILTYINLIF